MKFNGVLEKQHLTTTLCLCVLLLLQSSKVLQPGILYVLVYLFKIGGNYLEKKC